jgi:CMP-N,N'-diacetyllegionaminic acid synthase
LRKRFIRPKLSLSIKGLAQSVNIVEKISFDMKILTLIPARGGSKRIPRKNIRSLGGKPLIVWSIDVAKDIPEVVDILVSTDDKEIAEIAKSAGAMVPWLRPPKLSTDTASSVDVCLHALEWYEKENGKVDGLMLLQSTSPFRSRGSILQGIDLFRRHKHRPVIGVSAAKSHPMWCFEIEKGIMRPFMKSETLHMRSQDLPPAYMVNGGFYLVSPKYLREERSFYKGQIIPLIIDPSEESMDIDTEWDWKLAEAIIKLQRTSK